jgi:hypothetical protein
MAPNGTRPRALWRNTTFARATSRIHFENRSSHPRSVVLAMSLDRNAALTGPDAVDFDAADSRPLAVFVVGPRMTVKRQTHAVEGLVRTTALGSLTSARVSEIAAAASLEAADRGAVVEGAAKLRGAAEAAERATQTKNEIAEVEKDLERLREHMKALAGERAPAGAGTNPFALRVLAAEDRLSGLRGRLSGLDGDSRAKRDAAQAAFARLVQ